MGGVDYRIYGIWKFTDKLCKKKSIFVFNHMRNVIENMHVLPFIKMFGSGSRCISSCRGPCRYIRLAPRGRALFKQIIIVGYYCPSMVHDAKTYINKCKMYQRHVDVNITPLSNLNKMSSPWLFS